MVTGFPARVLEMIDSLIARDKLEGFAPIVWALPGRADG